MYKKLYKVSFRNNPIAYYACDSLAELESKLDDEYSTIEYIEEVFVIIKNK